MLVFRYLLKVFKDRCVQQSSGEKYELSLITVHILQKQTAVDS